MSLESGDGQTIPLGNILSGTEDNQMIWIAAVSTQALMEDGLIYHAVKNISLFAKEK